MSNNKSKLLEFKRILRQYEYSTEDLNDLKDLESHIKGEFGRALASMERSDLFDTINPPISEDDVENIIPEERDPAFKKLFRKVVVACHPDKLSNDLSILQKAEKKALYERVIIANDTYNWAELIIVAIKLSIDIPEEYYEYIENLKKESEKVHEKINTIQGSIAWKWYHSETEEERNIVMATYISFLEKSKYEWSKEEKLILGLGHPRTGTGYTSNLFNAWGLDIGHEKIGEDGIIAWQLASKLEPRVFMETFEDKYRYKYIIYNVRNPKNSIPSIVHTETRTNLYRFCSINVASSENPVENAIISILGWDKLITARNPDFTYRVEDQSKDLYDFLVSKNIELGLFIDSHLRNKREHDGFDTLQEQFNQVRPELREQINEYCEKYGYPKLF